MTTSSLTPVAANVIPGGPDDSNHPLSIASAVPETRLNVAQPSTSSFANSPTANLTDRTEPEKKGPRIAISGGLEQQEKGPRTNSSGWGARHRPANFTASR